MSLKTGKILKERYQVNTVLKAGGRGSIYRVAYPAQEDPAKP